MSTRILTLFGEEITPVQAKPAVNNRAAKKDDTAKEATEINAANDTVPEATTQLGSTEVEEKVKNSLADESVSNEVNSNNTDAAPTNTELQIEAEIIPEDWKGDKTYYTIGEAADFFKVKTSHIRFWTNEFKLKVRTTRKGDRLFTPAQIKELRAIYHLVKERGFTLSGAKTKLKEKNGHEVASIDLKDSLLTLRNKLLILRNQL